MRKLLIALLALVVLLVAGDRIAAAIAENQISGRIAAAYGLRHKPAVTIEGFPFLTQVLTGHYDRIDISANEVGSGGATFRHLDAHFTGVHAPLSQVLSSGASGATAAHASGTATVGYGEVDQRLPRGLRLHAAGKRLEVSGGVRVPGGRVPVSTTVSLGVTASGIKVTPVKAGASAGGAYSSRLDLVVPLSGLPLHLRLSSVQVTRGGLRIGASARDVHFAGGAARSASGG
jgi:LmeA-like phospholipid-binding